jgi:tRNA pseudouridine13 synthase
MSTDDCAPTLPFLSAELPGIGGVLRSCPEDFLVEEVPAYAPSGEGDHLFVFFEKRGLDTPAAVKLLANALGVDPAGASWAGLKDRHAVTRQWASFAGARADRTESITLDEVTVLDARPHPHKLRTGHLRGNRFVLTVRDPVGDVADAQRICDLLLARGTPNYYGEQRFGRDNLERARRWIDGTGRPPRSRFERKMLASVLQSAIFNAVCAERVHDGSLDRPLEGDLLRKEDTGGMFTTDDLAEATERMARWEVSATGPMVGPKMRWPEGEARRREVAAAARWGLGPADRGGEPAGATEAQPDETRGGRDGRAAKVLGRAAPGSRRPIRIRLGDPQIESVPGGLRVAFTLPAGAYATVVMRELQKGRALKKDQPGAHGG